MKILRQILFMALLVVGFSMTAMAQKQEDKRKPPKPPEQIVPKEKDKPKDQPKNDNRNNDRGKKPQFFIISSVNQAEITSV